MNFKQLFLFLPLIKGNKNLLMPLKLFICKVNIIKSLVLYRKRNGGSIFGVKLFLIEKGDFIKTWGKSALS